MAKSYVQIPTAYLSGSGVVIAATTITINSFTDIYGNVLTMADFGDKGYGTIEPDTTNEESFTFTSITANANGTVTLGGIFTSLAKTPYTETSGLIRAHVGGSKVVVSDTAAFWATFGNKNNDEALTGRWTGITPVNPADLATKAYVDAAATGLATLSAEVVNGIAGENLTSGRVVYLLQTDSKWYLADSSIASKSVGVLLGIAQSTVLTNASVNILLSGEDTKQTALTANSVYYLSTAGTISTTKGANIRIVGRTKSGSTTNFWVDFTNDPNVSLVDGSRTYVADTGAANAYVATLVPAITAADLKAGFMCSFKAVNANTTTSTLNVNGLGVKTIKKLNGATNLASGDIAAGMIVYVQYDGTNFIMINPPANASASSADVQIFTTPGANTWTKLAGAKWVEVTCIGGGGAGGSGTPLNNPSGGGGGGWGYKRFAASALGATESVTVGAAGVAGANNTAGGNGGFSSFGTTVLLRADGGNGGSGSGPATGGAASGEINFTGGSSGSGGAGAGVSIANSPAPRGGGNGGYNGGSPATATAGGAGGGFTTYYVVAGGAGGAAGVNNGVAGAAANSGLVVGGVGGGGAGYNGNGTNTGGNGGAGGFPGGGGGGSVGTNNTGGNGASGVVVVVTYF